MFRALDEAAWTRRGVASNNEVTVRALAYMIAGHELHHRRIFQTSIFRQYPDTRLLTLHHHAFRLRHPQEDRAPAQTPAGFKQMARELGVTEDARRELFER